MHFKGVVLEVAAVRGDAQAEGNLFAGFCDGRLFGDAGNFDFTFPFEGDEAPAGIVHLGEVDGSRQDGDLLTHAIDLFHGSLHEGRLFGRA